MPVRLEPFHRGRDRDHTADEDVLDDEAFLVIGDPTHLETTPGTETDESVIYLVDRTDVDITYLVAGIKTGEGCSERGE